jgi:tryptophanyl-tRNA synthetase
VGPRPDLPRLPPFSSRSGSGPTDPAAAGGTCTYYFIADYHALTTVKDRQALIDLTYEVAAAWLAMGLDPDQVTLYRQSDLPEVFELTWILGASRRRA